MRLALLAAAAVLISGCLTLFGVHDARAREAAVAVIGKCDDVAINVDDDDKWLWHASGCRQQAWCRYNKADKMRCFTDGPPPPPKRRPPNRVAIAARVGFDNCGGDIEGESPKHDVWVLDVCGVEVLCTDYEVVTCNETARSKERTAR